MAQSEVKENDEANLQKLEELRANIVRISNEASLKFAEMENEQAELEVQGKQFKSVSSGVIRNENVFFCRKSMKK